MEDRVPGYESGTKQMAASTAKPGCRGYRDNPRRQCVMRNAWSLAIVEQAKPDAQGLVRSDKTNKQACSHPAQGGTGRR